MCCSTSGSRFSIYSYIRQPHHHLINNKNLPFFVVVTFKIKTREFNFDHLPIVLPSNICIRSYPDFFISFIFLKQPVQDTEGRAVLLSLSPFGWMPGSLGRNQELQVPSQLIRSLISQTSMSPLLALGCFRRDTTIAHRTEASDV